MNRTTIDNQRVLGIADASVGGGAVLAEDGQVTAAVNEERLDRQKLSTGFPALSIEEVLRITDTKPSDVVEIRVAEEFNYFRSTARQWKGWLADRGTLDQRRMYRLASLFSRLLGTSALAQEAYYALRRTLTRDRRSKLPRLLQERFGITCPVRYVDHHFCHALAAYYTAGHPDATVITLDGGGDGLCSRVYRVRQGRFELLHKINSYHSIGNFYAYVTHICGFTAHQHEGKITGLSAQGEPIHRAVFDELIRFENGTVRNRGNCYYWSAVDRIRKALPDDFRMEDLAASIQAVLEDVAVRYCDHWIRKSGLRHVAVAGGVFANVRLNQFVHELPNVQSFFVHPGMSDEGLAFGAALSALASVNGGPGERPQCALRDVYLGPVYSERRIAEALGSAGVEHTYCRDIESRVAELICEGRVVGRFNGRMEYGPRALGNRSILYRPDDPSVNDWLNEKLGRSEFMPFAPAVRADLAGRCFHGIEGAEHTAEFMTITFECTDEMRRACPGVVHVDGSARPQLVTRDANSGFYKILEEVQRRSNLPSVINTSYNIHEEPIVCTPEDGVKAFLDAELDYLAMGPFLAANPRKRSKHAKRLELRQEPVATPGD